MRVFGSIPHPSYSINAFSLERYYYVEIEAGPMKQCYKLPKDSTNGMQGIREWLSEDFLKDVQRIFEDMFRNHKAALDRISGGGL